MTKNDLARMVSLADDKYIDELFMTKLYAKKSIPWTKVISAAAMITVVAGIGAAAMFISSGNDRPDLQTIVSETETSLTDYVGNAASSPVLSVPEAAAKRTMPIDYDENFDYGVYFQIDRFDGVIDYTIDAGGQNYYFDSDYVCETVPFDTSKYDEPKTATVFCDESGKPVNAHIFCTNVHLNSGHITADIIINDDGALFPEYWFDEDGVFENAPERFGVKIAGHTNSNGVYDYKSVCAVFRVNGVGYTVRLYGMTYAEAVGIIDSLIESNLKVSDFDISRGVKQRISLEEANEIEPYAGYVPQADSIGEMVFTNCRRERDINGEYLFIFYTTEYVRPKDEVRFISMTYYTSAALFEENTHLNGAGICELYDLENGLKLYAFNYEMDGFYINGQMTCTEAEMKECVELITGKPAEDIGGSFSEGSYSAPVGHRVADGVSFTSDVKDMTADVTFSYPSEWQVNNGTAEMNGKKVLVIAPVWFASEGYDPEDYKIDMVMGREVTVIEEKYGGEKDGYKYMIHRSVPDYYSDTGVFEQYLYVIKSGDFYITVSFVVSEYLPDSECMKRIVESVRISSPEYEEFQAQLNSAYGTLMQPVTGKVTAGYSMKTEDYHKGVDFDVPLGTKVFAADDGTVVTYEDTDKGYGNCVIIDHGKGMVTLYAHLSETNVKEGDKVKRGDVIGLSGNTGTTESDCLHFEVRVNGRNADPELFLEKAETSEAVSYHGREFVRSKLSAETLEWLDWYNDLTEEEQLAISYEPAELR